METREIFDAAPLAISQFLSETGQGLYIPPYQRNYTWEQAKVRRLFEDVSHGLNQLAEFNDSICFLGTVIALRDLEYTTVEPIHRPQVPPKVMTIIDGQQRLTSVLLLVTVLHEEIRMRSARVRRDSEAATWCYNQALDVTKRLSTTYEEDMRYGDAEFQHYPRMTRSYYDVWSREKPHARYESPIGYHLHKYGLHTRSDESNKQYRHSPIQPEATDDANYQAHRHLTRIRETIRRSIQGQVKSDVTEETGDAMLPALETIAESESMQNALFNTRLPEGVRSGLLEEDSLGPLVRLIVFANYLLQRVTVAVVTAKREDYGFDMFEALNTTGEPLTAIETFKPRVIQAEGLDAWKNSPCKKSFDVIDAYLDREGNSSADRRQTITSNLLVPFALTQSGARLSKRLNAQRRHLRESFAEQPDLEAKRDFLAMLAHLAHFMQGPWATPGQMGDLGPNPTLEEARLSLAVLKDGSHDIVAALLTRYFTAWRVANPDDVEESARHFLEATRACAAFYALWRGSQRTTAGIDDVYRKLMATGDSGLGVPPFARRTSPLTSVPDVGLLRLFLRQQLAEKGLDARDKWVQRAAGLPVYSVAKPLTRFLLLAASRDSTPDPSEPGLVVRGKEGILETLTLQRWRDETTLTIEHVAPQTQNTPPAVTGWDPAIYDGDASQVNCLGNLTLLPIIENSSASNRVWGLKRLMYQALSSATVEDAERYLSEAATQGLVLGHDAQQIVRKAKYLPLVAALGHREGDWSSEFIQIRSQRLAELAWDSLAPWLDIQ